MIKNMQIKISALMLSVAFLNTDAFAECKKNHSFSLGLEGSYYRYNEPKFMQYTGSFYGLNTDYFYRFSNNLTLGAEARIDFGLANYKSKNTGRDKNIKQFLVEPRVLVGYTFKTSSVNLTPFSGVGYRFKSDHSGGKFSTTGHHGYDRTSQYLYLPLGLTLSGAFNKSWDWQTTGEFDLLLAGRQKSNVTLNTSSRMSIIHKQKKGWGLKGEYLVGYNTGSGKLSAGPFVNYWNIKKSNVNSWTIEPKNNTLEVGLKVKWTF